MPQFFNRSAKTFEDFEDLTDLALAVEKRFTVGKLIEYAADGPDVHGSGVVLGAEQNVGRTVPERDDLVREVLDRDSEGTGQTKVRELEHVLSIDQQVLWLQVSVKYLVLVALGRSAQQLVQEGLKLQRKRINIIG